MRTRQGRSLALTILLGGTLSWPLFAVLHPALSGEVFSFDVPGLRELLTTTLVTIFPFALLLAALMRKLRFGSALALNVGFVSSLLLVYPTATLLFSHPLSFYDALVLEAIVGIAALLTSISACLLVRLTFT